MLSNIALATAQQLVGQIYVWAGIAVALGVGFIVTAGLWFWRNHSRTKISKIIDSVKNKNVQLLLAASLGSFAKLLKASDFNPEGVIETIKFKNRAKNAKGTRRKTYFPPRKVDVGSATEVQAFMTFPEGVEDGKKLV